MATLPSKHHQPLHNFSLPFLKWGQRIQSNNHCLRRHRHRNSPLTDTSDSDLNNRTKPHRFPDNTKREFDGENGVVSPDGGNGNSNSSGKLIDVDVATAVNGDVKPWNLRPRRFVIDTVDGNGAVAVVASAKLGRSLRGVAVAAPEDENEEEKKKRRLWISLSKEEIEEDIYAFTGSRPSRRPKKRNKIAQKHLDNVFPGLYLVGASADSYRV
ncbi:hypothetical protein L1987_25868 [Smallanthus sonchifolius]|uniref:Uncharacterized protein n=1 Tax=Smallanthus sonchifolius TaxID=185202 RepID=A0ACB9I9X4_9ASTR|nr:hypothetical protein L1987_25868 [Smallanthus sonchifolius]